MSRTFLALMVGGVGILAASALLLVPRGGSSAVVAVDLVDTFPEAEKRTDVPSLEMAFAVEDVTIDGETRRSIFAHPSSRISWTITVPPGAALETAFAVRPDAWDRDGDGVQFRVGVSHGGVYDEFLREHVRPKERAQDRRWHTISVPLARYEGQTVEVIFNTDPGPPGDWDARFDFAVWGAPSVVLPRR